MPRSLKKGPYVNSSLVKKVEVLEQSGEKKIIKTWSRSSVIIPKFLGHTISVHNGSKFIPIYITDQMIGHKLGEFSPTRFFRSHVKSDKKIKKK